MSTGRRMYDLVRGYVNHEWERIQGISTEDDAQRELNEALDNPVRSRGVSGESVEYEVIVLTQEEKACQILGVAATASFDEIRTAFDRLNERSDPAKFPDGSVEAERAAEIRSRVHKAFRILADRFDTTETRFKSLEID